MAILAAFHRLGRLAGRAVDRTVARLISDRAISWWGFVWARLVLRARRPVIVGVTGSVGKTTTVRMVESVLSHATRRGLLGPVCVTRNNMNNHAGLPLVVLGYDNFLKSGRERLRFFMAAPWRALVSALGRTYPAVLVLEYGTDRPGSLPPLVDLAPPDIAIVTAIGPSHLERLGSELGVAREKASLIRGTKRGGLAILGTGHAYLQELERESEVEVTRVSGPGAELSCAIARSVAKRLKIPEHVVEEGLATAPSVDHRLTRIQLPALTIIDDSFNANPLSMRLALETLRQEPVNGGRRVAALGDMLELGEYAIGYHEEIGKHAREVADLVVAVGALAVHYKADSWFPDSEACAEAIESLLGPRDCVLVKGSHGINMRVIVRRLREIAALEERAEPAHARPARHGLQQ